MSTTRSDASFPNPYRARNGSASMGTSAPRPRRPTRSGTEDSEKGPALAVVMSAFQSAARKKTVDTYGDDEWERERQQEVEAERQRQKRIMDKVPGRRANGKAKAGDIDGMSSVQLYCSLSDICA